MAEIITMPKLSDTMEEGAIANWLKKEGEFVQAGENLAEIETDKATMEYQSPEEGFILKILVEAGKSTALNAPIAVLGKNKDEKFDLDKLVGSSIVAKKLEPNKAKENPKTEKVEVKNLQGAVSAGRVKASPLAKKIAKEKGIDLQSLHGSGPMGRVIQKDLQNTSGSTKVTTASLSSREDRIIPVTMMRKTIAKRLLAGKNDAPHFYLKRSVRMDAFLDWRKKLIVKRDHDASLPKISVNDLLLLVTAKALRHHPEVNASWEGEQIRQWGAVHMAMAVALPEGLVTPVVRHADQIGIWQLAKTTSELNQKAKDGKLTSEDYSGGTFTISNLGMMGIEEFTAIINPPQAAILAVGATMATPWVTATGEIKAQQRMSITMSCDHRVIDGAMGAKFLDTLVRFIEDPLEVLG